jgi:hypothetical protein
MWLYVFNIVDILRLVIKRTVYESSESVAVFRYFGTTLKIAKGLHAEIRAD